MEKNPALNDCPTCEVMEKILLEYTICKEVLPYKGVIDYEQKKITVNPAFDMVEILAHEMLHHYYEVFLGTGAAEWLVREKAREIIKQQEITDLIDRHLKRATSTPARNLFGMAG